MLVVLACQREVIEVAAATAPPTVATPPAVEAQPAPTVEPSEPTLSYIERVVHADAEARLPLVVAIHGLGDRPERFIRLFDGFDQPARVVAPRAPRSRRAGGFSWFPGMPADRDLTPLVSGARSSATELAALIDALRARRPTCGEPIVVGFSQGGLLSLALAVYHPEVVGVAVPVGGWLPPPMWPAGKRDDLRYPEIHALHGARDALVPFASTRTANDRLAELGFTIETRSYPTGHTISREMRRDLFELVRKGIADVAPCD